MGGPVYEAVLTERARAFIDELSDVASQRAWRVIRMLEADPFVDGRTKFAMTIGARRQS